MLNPGGGGGRGGRRWGRGRRPNWYSGAAPWTNWWGWQSEDHYPLHDKVWEGQDSWDKSTSNKVSNMFFSYYSCFSCWLCSYIWLKPPQSQSLYTTTALELSTSNPYMCMSCLWTSLWAAACCDEFPACILAVWMLLWWWRLTMRPTPLRYRFP